MGSLVENQEKALHPAISVKWDALKNPKLSQFILGTVSLLLCLLLWQALAQFKINLGIVNFSNVPTPVEVVQAIIQFFQLPTALAHLKASMLRVLIGFALAGVIGVALGLLIGQYKKMAAFFLTPLEVLRPIPAVAWIPLAILIFP